MNHTTSITVEARSNYGRTDFYPMCPLSRLFCAVARTQTLTRNALELIQHAGYTVVIRPQKVTL